MREEDTKRTIDCLRGRLVAERAASRNAKEAAHLMGNKLMELEAMLKEETELRNRAEKRFKHVMKKLESINISLTLHESESWSLTEGSEDSSASSYTACSTSKDLKHTMLETQQAMCSSSSSVGDSQETMGNGKTEQNGHLEFIKKKDLRVKDDGNSMGKLLEEQAADSEEKADNSLAFLAPVCSPNRSQTIDPAVVLHANNLRDVLDSLRHAREKLQNQMERRHLIRVTYLPKKVISHGLSLHCGIIRG
ncbi:hypothetical protein DM860_014612 [Cuscuta australis]|uniref:Uncharacterized protein n=1 Tax=Cuscuta australis TaxID=267555 RepID=A0A328DHE5_9ASTE|nr:hypothetical protein DM860_014612 [Cuscuta australis]